MIVLKLFLPLPEYDGGIFVVYSPPNRHGFLKVVENNYCASRRGGVRCLSILNVVFDIICGLLAIFLGSSLLKLGSSCSVPLCWCYEVSSWGRVNEGFKAWMGPSLLSIRVLQSSVQCNRAGKDHDS
ncbi:hypothetical protein Bca4012_015550 [Brassica carinata]